MKKILSLIFVFVLTVAITLGLASCGKDVEFNVNFIVDGEVYATVGTSGEETIKIPENPTKDGYIFDGWYWDNGTWQKPFTANSLLDAPLSENMSVYAKWVCAHSASDWILDTDATCKEVGSKHKECTKCEEVLETGTIDKLTTHTPASAAIENKISSTCSKLGSYDEVVKCSVCGIELSRVEKEISKKDHTPITDSRVEPTDTEDGLTEGSHCSECGAIIVAQEKIPALVQGTEFKSAALAIEGDKITGVFSNATVVFSFLNDINVAKDANYVVARDIYCESVINSKTVTLEEGDNTFYLLVTNGDSMKLYTATLRRRPMYTVRFNANGGTSISTQYVEEGYLAEEPSTTRIGYTFVSWDYNFDTPITSNVTIKASWDANDDTPYKVEYYLQNLDKTGYDLVTSEEEKLSGTTDTTAYAEQKTFEHFTLNSYMSTLSGNINGNGNLVLKVYYTRNTYNISTSRNNTKAGTVTSGGTYLYDKEITLTATTNTGYTFLGWFDGETNVCDTLSYSFKVDHSTTYTAKWETNVYNITYKLNGGVNNESNVATYTIETPTITLSSPERTGYEFGGWFFDEEFTTPATKITLGSYGEKTFYAKWTPIVYKITYDHNYQGATTDTAYVIINDSTYPWNNSNGALISSNKANSSSATYKIVANTEITVSFKYKVSSESNFDFLTIAKNGVQKDRISGSTSYVSYSTTLYAGEYITFTYSKDGSQSSGNDCAYIAELVCAQNRYTTEVEYDIETATFDLMIPERAGYTFKGWFTEETFENQVSNIPIGSHGNKTLYAKWEARTDTPYRIEYYLENVDKNGYEIVASETENLTGTTDTIANAEQKVFDHFTIDEEKSTLTGNIGANGSLVLSVYYTRNVYTLSNSNTNYGSITNAGSYVYGSGESFKTVASVPKLGYEFLGWYSGEELLSTEREYTFNIDKNVVAKFEIIPEMQNFVFTSTDNTCSITGIKDKTVTEIIVPDYVTAISGGVFSGCSNLESLTLPFVGGSKSATSASSSTLFGYIFGTSSYTGGVSTKQYYSSSSYKTYYTPSSLKSLTVTGGNILYGAFYNCTSLTSVTIPDSVTRIGGYAFLGCTNLTSVTIPDSVTSIGNGAFYNCISLTSITIPDGVTSIGEYAFSGCTSLTSITIPDSITSIGSYAFCNCDSLTSITIPDSVTSIGSSAFNGCSSLESISLPFVGATKGGTSNTHFGYIFGASSYSSNDNYVPSSLKTVIITDSTSISEYAFYDCINLTNVTIPEGVTSIGSYAFYDCISLASVTIPDSVTSIGEYAFSDCTSLTSVYIANIAKWCEISFSNSSSNPLCYANNLYLNGELVTDIAIPDEVTSIPAYAFSCNTLISITIPDSVTSIGASAFRDCINLTSITIPNSVTSIGSSAFNGCTSLESISLPFVGATKDRTSNTYFGYIFGASSYYSNDSYVPSSLKTVIITDSTSIGSYAFYDCISLASVTIPDSVTSIGEYAFRYCSSLTSITIPDSVTSIGNYAFYACYKLVEVINHSSLNVIAGDYSNGYVGYYAKEIHKGDSKIEKLNDYLFYTYNGVNYLLGYIGNDTVLVLPESYNGENYIIYYYAFYGNDKITSVTIPNSVTSIGSSAFYSCDSLTSVNIPDSVTSIGYYAFYSCDSLTSVNIPDSVTSIGSSAFYSCDSLTSVNIPDSVTSIGSSAFYSCDSLTRINVSVGNKAYKSIDGNLYSKDGKTLIQYAIGKTDSSLTIPNSVTSIGSSAFYDCTSLKSMTIGDGVKSIGDSAFGSCTSLTSVTIGNSVTSIGFRAFSACTSLTSIVIPDSVTSIDIHAFDSCTSLTSVTIGNGVTSIASCAFQSCTSLMSVTIGNSVTSIGSNAFYNCSSLTSIKYRGSQQQWNSISKGEHWNQYYSNGSPCTINYTMTYNYTGEQF